MLNPRMKRCKTLSANPKLDPKLLFSGMAYDLKVNQSCEYIDAYSLLANGKYSKFLATLDEWTSQMYESVGDFRHRLHQLAALLSKYPFVDSSIDRDKVALSKFSASEHRCRRMNQKFFARRRKVEPPHMQFMRSWIEKVIGLSPDYSSILSRCDFGPGASVGVHGNQTSFVRKLKVLTGTPGCIPVALTALRMNRHYSDVLFQGSGVPPNTRFMEAALEPSTVLYNKIVCVPKNAKTNRTIAIEPTLNGYVQKGIDLVLRQKLKRFGRDLSSQALNQSLAHLGSRDGSYATIDLSAASDSISIQLVKELLPPDWFNLLNATRSPMYQLPDGSLHRYEKFCSMGNGFCFPLETLIFSAACEYAMSVASPNLFATYTVYGDDIIVPQSAALLVLEVLRDLGFRHNESKTFIAGGFRESCGADFFFGTNVRPIYFKDSKSLNHEVFPIMNALRRKNLLNTWQRVHDVLPPRFRLYRPYPRDDDSALDAPLDVFMTSKHSKWNRDTHSWNWKGIVVSPSTGISPSGVYELIAGKLRGDLSHTETFVARNTVRTRLQVKT